MSSRRTAILTGALLVITASTAVAFGASSSGAATADSSPTTGIVSAVPSASTPDVGDGTDYEVDSILQVGSTIYQGGTFTTVYPPGVHSGDSGGVAQADLYAADSTTGAFDTAFAPQVNGAVDAMVAGPVAGTIFIGGSFTTVDGRTSKSLALINASDGTLVADFTAPAMNGVVNTMALAHGDLIIGGTFTTLKSIAHAGLGAINTSTGAVDPYVSNQVSGHHNYGVNCTSSSPKGCADAPVGVTSLAVSPDGSQLMAIGNFTSVDGASRDQVARILLGASSATVDPNWATQRYTSVGNYYSYDSYVRQVAYSPDGSYFVIVATGGGGKPNPASTATDAALRFETASTGSSVQPTWADYAGNDTLFSVAITASTVYVGGHQRWLNNANGSDSPGGGALPRPGIAALDPSNGLPFSWNPGRNPRGARVDVLYTTSAGLWVGGDTNYVGDGKYYRAKDSFFPYAGGETLPAAATLSLPGTVYLGGSGSSNTLASRSYDGMGTVGPTTPITTSDPWSTFKGAFMVDGNLIYAKNDGNLYSAPFSGGALSTSTILDPYDDPTWDNVQTGSGQTYQGTKSPFYGEIATVTGMTYSHGFLFYTLSGKSALYYRYFTPESGVTGATEFTATMSNVSLTKAVGLIVSGGSLYWADSGSGALMKASFTGPSTPNGIATVAQVTGPATVANSTYDWRADALFVGPSSSGSSPPPTPTASFSSSCSGASCSFDGTGSSETGGGISSYAWNFGDGSTGTGAKPSHTYTASGTFTVTLTVTDNQGATSQPTSHQVTATVSSGSSPGAIGFDGVADTNGNSKGPSVATPGGAKTGDLLVLFATVNSSTNTITGPDPSWTMLFTASNTGMETIVWTKTATAADLGGSASISFGTSYLKSDLEMAAYSGVTSAGVRNYGVGSDASSAAHTTPGLTTTSGDWVISYWADKSSTTTAWTPPGGQTQRKVTYGSGGGEVTALLTDYDGPVGNSVSGLTATTNAASRATDWSIELAAS